MPSVCRSLIRAEPHLRWKRNTYLLHFMWSDTSSRRKQQRWPSSFFQPRASALPLCHLSGTVNTISPLLQLMNQNPKEKKKTFPPRRQQQLFDERPSHSRKWTVRFDSCLRKLDGWLGREPETSCVVIFCSFEWTADLVARLSLSFTLLDCRTHSADSSELWDSCIPFFWRPVKCETDAAVQLLAQWESLRAQSDWLLKEGSWARNVSGWAESQECWDWWSSQRGFRLFAEWLP